MNEIKLQVIEKIEELIAIESEWEKFREQIGVSNMCTSHVWLLSWCRHFLNKKDQLAAHCFYQNDSLIAIFPIYKKKISIGYQLRFIGTGEKEVEEVCSEFQDFLLDPKFKQELLSKFSHEVLNKKDISAITFDNILITSDIYQWLQNINFNGCKKTTRIIGKRFLIPVKETQQDQLSSFNSKNIKRHAKKILADTRLSVTTVHDSASLKVFYQQLIKEHNCSWHKRNKKGAFEQVNFVDFHRVYSEKTLKNKKLVAFELACENEYAALFYGIIDGDTLFYYQSAINHESKLSSAGVAMHVIALDIARECNLAFYDLMKGSSNSYKKQYIENNSRVVSCTLSSKKYRIISYMTRGYKKALYWPLIMIEKVKCLVVSKI